MKHSSPTRPTSTTQRFFGVLGTRGESLRTAAKEANFSVLASTKFRANAPQTLYSRLKVVLVSFFYDFNMRERPSLLRFFSCPNLFWQKSLRFLQSTLEQQTTYSAKECTNNNLYTSRVLVPYNLSASDCSLFALEPPVTARANPQPFYCLRCHQF